MSLVHLSNARKGASPEQATVHNMLVENGQLIETIAEYQRMGRIEDATKYQELLHRNILYLAKLVEQSEGSELAKQFQPMESHESANNEPPVPPPSHASQSSQNAQTRPQQPPISQLPTQAYPLPTSTPHLQPPTSIPHSRLPQPSQAPPPSAPGMQYPPMYSSQPGAEPLLHQQMYNPYGGAYPHAPPPTTQPQQMGVPPQHMGGQAPLGYPSPQIPR
ncbi:SS18-like protein 2 [Ditylenchus destructor]|uniref:SS18-like protein 2 n=1 Tax=Ditylenchus destructor TaxID=166010 RepID=A0AAD4N8W7_9BILA|nr:SS18-like protein 2 [Ditylenchus destructor]